MEMDQQEREMADESPVSHNDEDLSDADPHSGGEQDDHDSCDEIRRHGMLADHNDVLTKLKMQVRDINVRDDFENQRTQLSFPMAQRVTGQDGIQFPVPVPFPFQHPAAFLPPMAPQGQPPSSGSSHSSEGSASSQHTWSFEEQFKQVRQGSLPYELLVTIPQIQLEDNPNDLTTFPSSKDCSFKSPQSADEGKRREFSAGAQSDQKQLYEINDDPKRKEFLDDLFSFMQKRGTPINRLPIMAKSVLDLYELYNLVIARGGLVDVINKKLWQEIIKGLHLPSSITSAAFTLRTQYMKYLYPYECDKKRLSTPQELQAAIDGNRREGRRSSYGQYDTMSRYGYESPNPAHQLNTLSLVSAAQQQQLAARMSSVMSGGISIHNGAHHPSHPQPLTQPMNGGPIPNLPNLAPSEFETRMIEYMKLLNKEIRASATTSPRQGEISPPNATSPLTPFEVQQRMNMFNLYNNNQPIIEPQKEPINLSEPTPSIKREQECRDSPPPPKRVSKEEDDPPKSVSPVSSVHTPSTFIKINSRGDARNGDNSLVVSMELNGVTYQGVLFAQTQQTPSHAAMAS